MNKFFKIVAFLITLFSGKSLLAQGALPTGLYLVTDNNGAKYFDSVYKKNVFLNTSPICSIKDIKQAKIDFNEQRKPVITVIFNDTGKDRFAKATKKYKGKRIAILVNDRIVSVAFIHKPINNGRVIMAGAYSLAKQII